MSEVWEECVGVSPALAGSVLTCLWVPLSEVLISKLIDEGWNGAAWSPGV